MEYLFHFSGIQYRLYASVETKTQPAPIHQMDEMRQLSAGELSAVCSNLARGCEKQYKERELSLIHI